MGLVFRLGVALPSGNEIIERGGTGMTVVMNDRHGSVGMIGIALDPTINSYRNVDKTSR
jgi:hypothetical protein